MLVTFATCKRRVDGPWSPVQNVCRVMRLSCGPGRCADAEADNAWDVRSGSPHELCDAGGGQLRGFPEGSLHQEEDRA